MNIVEGNLVVGITGFADSGKSFVLQVLTEMGWEVIDADDLVRQLYQHGEQGYDLIKENFGENFGENFVNEKEVDRSKLSKAIQAEPNKLELLNQLIHPLVCSRVAEMLEALKNKGSQNIAIEAVYFKPGGLHDFINQLIFIERPEHLIMKAEPFYSYLKEFYQTQMPNPDVIIKNDNTLKHFKAKVVEIFSAFPYK